MGEKRGCFKTGCLGCGGFVGVVVVISAVIAVVAVNGLKDKDIQDRKFTPQTMPGGAEATAPATPAPSADATPLVPAEIWRKRPGRVVLDLGQGDFVLRPAAAGQGLNARASFDAEVHTIEEHFETLPDSTWVYHIRYYRHMPGMQAMFRSLFGGGAKSRVEVYLPPEVPIDLDISVQEGGFEGELGGLWLTGANIRYLKGGFSLSIDEPLQQPLDTLSIKGAMGGFQAVRLGNASPANLIVDCRMGGGEVDLRGRWLRDCDAKLSVRMGGMEVRVPQDVRVEGADLADLEGSGLVRGDAEVPVPTLRLSVTQSMGEVEVKR
jgi:hypothetical protein